jgi:acetyl-CoA carboxylase alpha subunit
MAPNSAPYVVLSDSLWRRAFYADPGVVGTTVELNNHPFTVVGWHRRGFTARSNLSGRTTGSPS